MLRISTKNHISKYWWITEHFLQLKKYRCLCKDVCEFKTKNHHLKKLFGGSNNVCDFGKCSRILKMFLIGKECWNWKIVHEYKNNSSFCSRFWKKNVHMKNISALKKCLWFWKMNMSSKNVHDTEKSSRLQQMLLASAKMFTNPKNGRDFEKQFGISNNVLYFGKYSWIVKIFQISKNCSNCKNICEYKKCALFCSFFWKTKFVHIKNIRQFNKYLWFWKMAMNSNNIPDLINCSRNL